MNAVYSGPTEKSGHSMNHQLASRWTAVSSLVFGVSAWIIKAAIWPHPEFNPPAIYPALVASLLAALFWWWLVERSERATLLRGGFAGAAVGLLTPVLVWPLFLLSVALIEGRFPEVFFWAPVYMFFGLVDVSWMTAVPGIILGIILAYFRREDKG